MMRILHLCPARREFQTRRCLEHLVSDLGPSYRSTIMRIGSADEPLSVPAGALILQSRRASGADVVHAWGTNALWAALLARCPRIVHSPLPGTRLPCRRMLAPLVRRAGLQVVCPSESIRRRFLHFGFAPGRCQTIRPAVDLERIVPSRNAALRAELGFGDCDDVILAPGETVRGSGHRQVAWAAGILNVLDQRRRLLVWGRGDCLDELRNFAEQLAQPNLLTVAEHRLRRSIDFESLAAAADVAVVCSRGTAATLGSLICMAAGVPIVASDTAGATELLENGRAALVRPRATPMMLAQCVLDLERDATMRQRLANAARATAAQTVSLPDILARWRAVYDGVACGREIDLNAIAG
jgi:glycosyltransferase involved in cell wall biosynthesis